MNRRVAVSILSALSLLSLVPRGASADPLHAVRCEYDRRLADLNEAAEARRCELREAWRCQRERLHAELREAARLCPVERRIAIRAIHEELRSASRCFHQQLRDLDGEVCAARDALLRERAHVLAQTARQASRTARHTAYRPLLPADEVAPAPPRPEWGHSGMDEGPRDWRPSRVPADPRAGTGRQADWAGLVFGLLAQELDRRSR